MDEQTDRVMQRMLAAMSAVGVDGSLSNSQMFDKLMAAGDLDSLTEDERRRYEYNLGAGLKGIGIIGPYEDYKLGDWKKWIL